MDIHKRFITTLAVAGVLAAGGASVAQAQDTSAAARQDTMGYKPSGQTDTTQADTGKFQYNGAPSDTALRAKPGVQTGPAAGDSGKASEQAGEAGVADTVVCIDGSNAARTIGCGSHGGIDSVATKAALKARGGGAARQTADTTPMPADTTQTNQQGAGDYQSQGAPSDTALNAKPGTQTGPTDSGAVKADTGTSR